MKWYKTLSLIGIYALLVLLLCACSSTVKTTSLSDADMLLTAQAANPLPTELANQGLAVVKTKACLVNTLVTVQTKTNEGDMVAWSPINDTFAYVVPDNEKWGWFVGNLAIWDVKAKKSVYTSQNLEIAGDLTWSPDGKLLAFIVLDPKTKTYTVEILDLANGSITDVFNIVSPQTDSWSSPKGIDKWSDNNTLLLTSSCDVDCSRGYSYDVASARLTPLTETRKKDDATLTLTNQALSPNSQWQVVLDINDNIWLSSSTNKQAAVISTGVTLSEIKWSKDSNYAAIRTDDSILVYQPVCSQ